MSKTFDQGKKEVAKLCRYFATNRKEFIAPGVKEAHVRQWLIDPFFEALGWDVRNAAMVAPQYMEVVPEESLDMEGQRKAPDYTFRVGTLPKFYAEAKKCGININADPAPAYQLRRYGWSAKVALSILTDFEETGVYDCSIRLRASDKASRARIQYFRFEEYADRWRELWDVFSREAVWSGAFDQYSASKRKRGTSEVDAEFLKEIEGWRDTLARNIAVRNKRLPSDDLNAAVQLTIDRVVFLRMAEDRGLEPNDQLLKLSEQPDIYARFIGDLCRKADQKYNSGLFHFQKEEGVSEAPDCLTPKLKVDDGVFKPILQSLYFAHGSPYHFGVMPVEILGTVYERFLGKVIRLTAGHQAKVEEKPEVRKAGGVYYTPSYIVNYIVKQTVARQIAGHSPAQLAGGKDKPPFRVLDMACGSGSFLLGAYQCLLDYCIEWYTEHKPETFRKGVYKDPANGHWRLTIEEKKRILTTHIFGVDIDPQAVEVSKLSLLLKVLESETDQTVGQQMRLFHERALPNLADNIKCGNSLIGSHYFTGKLIPDPEEMKRVNPFDWKQGFPDAMKAGGFDCVIGNPPYVRIQNMKEWAPTEVEIYKELYKSAGAGNYDIYVVFVEKGLSLLKKHGKLGFILPHKFFNAQYGEALRKLLAEGRHLAEVVHFGDQQVFAGATTYTCLMFLDKAGSKACRFQKVTDLAAWRANGKAEEGNIPAKKIGAGEWNFAVGPSAELFQKLNGMPLKLGKMADIFVGLQTSADDVFIMDLVKETPRTLQLKSKALNREWTFEKGILFPLVSGTDVSRFRNLPERQYILFPYKVENESASLLDFSLIKKEFPKTADYLLENKPKLEERERGKFRGAEWYRFGRSQNLGIQQRVKVCVPRLVDELCAAYDHEGTHFLDNVDVGGVTLKPEHQKDNLAFLVGLINSKLLRWYFPFVSAPFRGGWRSANRQFLSQLPIRPIDLTKPSDKAAHDRMVALVEKMLELHKQLAACKGVGDKTAIERLIVATDAEIDRIVYDLYSLTPDEIAIVEGKK